MITLRRAEDRRHVKDRDRDTWMSFDPDGAADPFRRGFRSLDSFNEERLAPGVPLFLPLREDVDVLTYVMEGRLIRPASSGRQETGEFRRSGAGGEDRSRVLNGSLSELARVFQCGLAPGAVAPAEQKRFPTADREGVLRLVASPDGTQGSLRWAPDVLLYSSVLLLGHHVIHEVAEGRGSWLHIVRGTVLLREHELDDGDGAALEGETSVALTARKPSEILLFDLA